MNGINADRREPLVSAIICTYNRGELLARAIGALCVQTMGSEHFEVIVIDDGSTDDTKQVVDSFGSVLPLRYAYQANSGLASGKNHGLFLSRAPIVLFLDDDDVADCDLLEQHHRTHQDFPQEHYAVLGYTDLVSSAAQSPLMHYVTKVGCHLFFYQSLNHGDILDFTYFWGGRSSCKRLFLLDHGVFNPVFRFGAEDIELGYRLSKVGLKVVYNKHAVSHMLRSLNFEDFCRRCYLQGRSNWVFSFLHEDEEVIRWAQTDTVQQEWCQIRSRYEQILNSAQNLDRYANERINAGLSIDDLSRYLLHRAYDAAFRACRIKGSFDMMADQKEQSFKSPSIQSTTIPEKSEEVSTQEESAQFNGLKPLKIRSWKAYQAINNELAKELKQQREYEYSLFNCKRKNPFTLQGYCYVCERDSLFLVDFKYAYKVEGVLTPNWRESLNCQYCELPNRMRAVVHILKTHFYPHKNPKVYITEQVTPLYRQLENLYKNIVGSEYLADSVSSGEIDDRMIRNENVTRLTFKDNIFDYILSFDVLEHVPDYRIAIEEFFRCLKPGGQFLFSVPFNMGSGQNIVRAKHNPDGSICHLLPPQYHGDPLNDSGCLSYYHFGWELLEELRQAGFTDVYAMLYWSKKYGYLGKEQKVFVARKDIN